MPGSVPGDPAQLRTAWGGRLTFSPYYYSAFGGAVLIGFDMTDVPVSICTRLIPSDENGQSTLANKLFSVTLMDTGYVELFPNPDDAESFGWPSDGVAGISIAKAAQSCSQTDGDGNGTLSRVTMVFEFS